jgi:hypothetical protein
LENGGSFEQLLGEGMNSRVYRTFLFLGMIGVLSATLTAQTNIFPSTGNVGIGTTSPQGILHINGANQNGNASPLFKLTDSTTGQSFTIDNGVNANDFRIVT